MMRRGARGERDHQRARELAAARADGFLTAGEAAWLESHLAGCDACSIVAADYGAQRSLFDAARSAYPETPRDRWARTAAAIDGERRPTRRGRFGRVNLVYAPLAGALVVAIVVGAGLLNGLPGKEPTTKGPDPDATPFPLPAGDVPMVALGDDGAFEISNQKVDEVCPVASVNCGLSPSPHLTQTGLYAHGTSWDAIISPDEDHVVVVDRGAEGTGVYVLDVNGSTAAGQTDPPAAAPTLAASLSPTPTAVPSPTPTDKATPAESTEPPTATPTGEPTASASPSEVPTGTPEPPATATAKASPSVAPSGSVAPLASVEPSTAPSIAASASPSGSAAPPSEGPSVEPSPTVEPSTTPEPASPRPTPRPSAQATAEPTPSVAVTPLPDGTIEIASNVDLIGTTAAYSADGSRFAFTARPADEGTGPDVYVWHVGDRRAAAITTDHESFFSGWLGNKALVSRVDGNSPRTFILSTGTGAGPEAHDGPMWRPTVGPDAATGVWWDGTVKPTADGHGWTPDRGRLVVAPWPGDDGQAQVLAGSDLADWQAEWDTSGSLLAVWTTTAGPGKPGALSLYTVDSRTGRVDLDHPKLDAAPAYGGFSLRKDRLSWSAPADGGDRTVQVLAWKGDTFGRLEILTQDGTSVVR